VGLYGGFLVIAIDFDYSDYPAFDHDEIRLDTLIAVAPSYKDG
jgi:hypothetical protein